MRKLKEISVFSFFTLLFLVTISCVLAEESITITTYYPSPYGSYKELSAYRMKIGATYSATAMTDADNGKLIVEGLVGIGTPTPGAKLHILNTGDAVQRIETTGGASAAILEFKRAGVVVGNVASGGTSNNMFFRTSAAGGGALYFQTLDSDRLIIDSVGNVGIGTLNPANLLAVIKSSASYDPLIRVQNTNTAFPAVLALSGGKDYLLGSAGAADPYGYANKFYIYDLTSNLPRMIIDGAGKVGIGTVNPVAALDVYGNGYLHVAGNANPIYTSQGAYFSWNKSGGTGETNFINNRGGGVGGFDFWNGTGSSISMLMDLDNKGNLKIQGSFIGSYVIGQQDISIGAACSNLGELAVNSAGNNCFICLKNIFGYKIWQKLDNI